MLRSAGEVLMSKAHNGTADAVYLNIFAVVVMAFMQPALGAGSSSGAGAHASSTGAPTGGITNSSSAVPTGSGNSLTSQSGAATGGINESNSTVPTGPGDDIHGVSTGQNGLSTQSATGGTNERSGSGNLGTGVNPYTGASVGQALRPNDLGFGGTSANQ